MKVVVIGTGIMGAQIGVEIALAGHAVEFVSRDPAAAGTRINAALVIAEQSGLFEPAQLETADRAIVISGEPRGTFDLAVESVPEDLELKVSIFRGLADIAPTAILASNTSSLSITALGTAVGDPRRVIGMHYLSPPLLTTVVEVVPGEGTDDTVTTRVEEFVRALGKRPVRARDVPGFVWNRLQVALLREAVWLVQNGVASPETIDNVVREGLARRWRHAGPFQTVALGGSETWERVSNNLAGELSSATDVDGLANLSPLSEAAVADLRLRVNRAFAADRLRERGSDTDRAD